MKQSIFSMRSTKYFLLLAVVVMAGMALSSCSKDDDDMKQNTLVLDEHEMNLTEAKYESHSDGKDIELQLYTANGSLVTICFNKAMHVDKLIPLNQKEAKQNQGWYWSIGYNTQQGSFLNAFGDPDPDYPTFDEGTLLITNFTSDHIKVMLKNGKVKGSDDKVYTLNLHYEGKIKLIE